MSGMATARPRMRARHEADFGVAAVVAVRMIGVQEVTAGRDDPRCDGFQRPPVEGMGLGAADRNPVEIDRFVLPDFDGHPRQAAHGLQVRNPGFQRFGRLEQHPVADLRFFAEQREGGVAPGLVGPAGVDMHPRGEAEPQRRQGDHDRQAELAAARMAVAPGEYRARRGHGRSPPETADDPDPRPARIAASLSSTCRVRSDAPAATARAGSSTTP